MKPAHPFDPLIHMLLGGLVFAIDRLGMRKADDPHTIVMGADVDREARETFKASRGLRHSETQAALCRAT